MKKLEKSIELGGRKLTLSTGHVALQADGAVIATYGETVVLATVVASDIIEDKGYFPLTVEYMEKLYAGGRIKGSRWVKREGRPTDDEILTARLIDRSIRPLFPKDYKKDVQVIITVLSVDLENTPDVVASYAVSAALAISEIPWDGPVGLIKVGLIEKKLITNPIDAELKKSEMELLVASTQEAIIMIESASKEVAEKEIIKGISHAQSEAKKVNNLLSDFAKKVGVKKVKVEKPKRSLALEKKVKELTKGNISDLIKNMATKDEGYASYNANKDAVARSFEGEEVKEALYFFEELFKENVRKMILSGKRPDGRKHDDIRELSAEIGFLPRTHGSAIFQRGQTQALTITTLGAPSLEQSIETAVGEETKRYIHHYTMPPYSTGETGRIGYPSRREIGHGALAERALLPVIPDEGKFPYTILVVSEILSSNGSTSMASTCASSLSLMDAGVPLRAPVAGIAMGAVIESEKKFSVLTDIVGIEDNSGDMDFKIAGTKEGITALQLDVKTVNLTLSILESAFEKAAVARGKILKVMEAAIASPKPSVSKYAPKIKVINIPKDKIGELIGPGGKTIRGIIAETGAQVDVEEDGSVFISAITEGGLKSAIEKVEALVKEVMPDEIYDGVVKRIEPYGAFVEVLPGKEGLVHVSDMSLEYVEDPKRLVNLGSKVKVRVKEIDSMGRINLSMILDREKEREKRNSTRGRDFQRDTQRGFNPRGRDRNRNMHSERRSGPHFPTSRLLDKKDFS